MMRGTFFRYLAKCYLRNSFSEFGKWFIWSRIVIPNVDRWGEALVTKTKDGLKYNVKFPDVIQMYIYFFGIWEPVITRYFKSTLSKGDIVIDVGANIGYFTCLSSKLVGETGSVHAIEASPSIFGLLRQNVNLNNISNTNLYNHAVFNKSSNLKLFKSKADNIGATSLFERDDVSSKFETVIKSDKLSDIVGMEVLKKANLIKIDIEGAEWFAIDGIKDVISEVKADWLVEIDPKEIEKRGGNLHDMMAVFYENGFSAYQIDNIYDVSWYMKDNIDIRLEELKSDFTVRKDVIFTRKGVGELYSLFEKRYLR